MTSFRLKVLVGSLLGLLLVTLATALLIRSGREARPVPEIPVVAAPEPAPAAAVPDPAPRPSRSKGQSDWTFFFRAGDTLSRMADGVPLGVVTRLERSHSFPDGSVGPAYVVRSVEQQEVVFDADELERSARIETIREIARPPIGTRSK
ncbi:MAG TPA: hypothetical protein VKH83_07720 [Methylomirabilota bacterium]|nr:hypothetical protein [Methylomirabilota bacterium]